MSAFLLSLRVGASNEAISPFYRHSGATLVAIESRPFSSPLCKGGKARVLAKGDCYFAKRLLKFALYLGDSIVVYNDSRVTAEIATPTKVGSQ